MLQPHIRLDESLNIRCALLPGDPARVDRVAKFLQDVEPLAVNREYRSVRGTYQGLPVLVMSTGMGGPSVGIAVEELKQIGVTHLIRIGSCGALQSSLALGDLLICSGAVRDDGTSKTYVPQQYPAIPDFELLSACVAAAKQRKLRHCLGLVRTHDSFYIDEDERISTEWSNRGVMGSDMETAALFTVGALRGLKTASLLNNVVTWGADTVDGIGSYVDGETLTAQGEQNMILTALDACRALLMETGI